MAVLKALKNIYKNPVVLVPDALLTLFVFLMAQLTIILTGIKEVFPEATEVSEELIRAFFKENAVQIIWPIALFFVTTFLVGIGFQVIKFELIASILKKKKVSFVKAWKYRFRYMFRVLLLKLLIFILAAIIIALIYIVFGWLLFLIINPFNPELAIMVSSVFNIVLLLLAFILIQLGILFRYPIMFLTKTKNPFKVLIESFKKFNNNRLHTLTTFLILLLVGLIVGVISILIALPQITALIAVTVLIGVLHQTWTDMFVFLKFKEKF